MSPQQPPNRLAELKADLTGRNSPAFSRTLPSSRDASPRASVPASGVVSVLHEPHLFDFVQFECMRGLTRSVRITKDEETGVLYFDEGQLVHAETAGMEGQEAALAILCWQDVRIEPATNIRVHENTIYTSWQGLLMMAAQRLDELPGESESRLQKTPAEKVFSNLEEFVEFRDADLKRAVRLDSEGEVISSRGDMQEFADAASYAVRLAELIGEGLGLENFSGLEAVTTKRVMLAYIDDESLVAVEGDHSTDLTKHRKRAGT